MLEQLQQRFSHPDVRFYQRDQLVMIELSNRHGTAVVTPFGATLLSYRPSGGEDLIWVSDTALYDGAKPVRGGVPVCWPWFGAYNAEALGEDPSDANKKGHGIARYAHWDVADVRSVDDATQVELCLTSDDAIRSAWPHDFELRLVVTLGETLQMDLTGENRSDREWNVSEAFHTYFNVAAADASSVHGLDDCTLVDKGQGGARSQQSGVLNIATPMEQVFLGHAGSLVLTDPGHAREIVIEKTNAASVVAWNPGPEGVKAFADMPDDQYNATVCVEAANALDDAYRLAPGARHTLHMSLAARPLQTSSGT